MIMGALYTKLGTSSAGNESRTSYVPVNNVSLPSFYCSFSYSACYRIILYVYNTCYDVTYTLVRLGRLIFLFRQRGERNRNPERSMHASAEMVSAGYFQQIAIIPVFGRKLPTRNKKTSRRVYYLGLLYGAVVPQYAVWIKKKRRALC